MNCTIRGRAALAALAALAYSVVALAIAAASDPALGSSGNPTVTVVNTTANPVPVSGTIAVGNSVLPVEVRNADPIPVTDSHPLTALEDLWTDNVSVAFGTNGGIGVSTFTSPIILLGLGAQITSLESTYGTYFCVLNVDVLDASDKIVVTLFNGMTPSGATTVTPYMPFPRVSIPSGYKLKMTLGGSTNQLCYGSIHLIGIKSH
jgi:hypothetical protein